RPRCEENPGLAGVFDSCRIAVAFTSRSRNGEENIEGFSAIFPLHAQAATMQPGGYFMRTLILAVSVLALAGSAAFADPIADRQAIMKANGKAVGTIAPMVKG